MRRPSFVLMIDGYTKWRIETDIKFYDLSCVGPRKLASGADVTIVSNSFSTHLALKPVNTQLRVFRRT